MRFEPRVVRSKFRLAAKVRHLSEAVHAGLECGPCHDCACYGLAFALQLWGEKKRKNLSQGS